MRKFFNYTLVVMLLALFTVPVLWAERKVELKPVDFDRVKKVSQDPRSRYYFPRLEKLYRSNTDTTMNLEDFRNLYYGYMFQEDYNPYRESQYSNKVEQLYYKKPHLRAECDSIEKYARLSLDDNIFDFDQMQFYIYILKEKKKYASAAVRSNKLERLIAAIISSGKGTKEEPWVVICPAHEYNIVNFLGFVATNHQEVDGCLDYITVEHKEGSKVQGFYFDIGHMLQEAKRKGYDN